MTTLQQEIQIAAGRRGLDPTLVAALVRVESAHNPYAWNPEPAYRYLWDVKRQRPFRELTLPERISEVPPKDFPTLAGDPDQEFWAQQASWGLMQVMGAVARELGFMGPYLPQLTDTSTNLAFGCLKLAQLLKTAEGDTERALAMYNGGPKGNSVRPFRNASYAAKVFEAQRAMKGTRA